VSTCTLRGTRGGVQQNKKVNVTGFDPSLGKVKDLDLVSAALAYDYDPSSHPCANDDK
jgi:hypothetical protein